MIKLERIHVKNYKNIAEADLELGQMNVVVGENNSGKSNLLEAIPLLNYIINGPVNDVKRGMEFGGYFNTIGDIQPSAPDKETSITIEFRKDNTATIYSYQIELKYENATKDNPFLEPVAISKELFTYKLKSKTGKPVVIFSREGNTVKYGNGVKKSDSIKKIEGHTSVFRLLSIIYRSENVSKEYKEAIIAFSLIITSQIFYLSPQLLRDEEPKFENNHRIALFDFTIDIELLKPTEDWGAFKNALKAIVNIDDVVVNYFRGSKIRQRQVFFKQSNRMKSKRELSDGTLVLIALITKLFSDASDIFFIEEPENSIHPRALSELMKLIRAKALDKQFIITTHSPYLLNMIKPEEVFVASVNKEGRSEIGKLPNVKAIKKKLAKSFMDFGDIVFSEPDTDEDAE